MSTVTIEYVWQAIMESERNDDIERVDDDLLIKAEATRSVFPRLDQSDAPSSELIAAALGATPIWPGNQASPILDGQC